MRITEKRSGLARGGASSFVLPCRRSRRGQILLPSLLVIPSLLIFVYLLFETTKISREKIRQQFAIDSAAFIQMGDYTNFLNRTAYVNGPFPYRIFRERYACPPEEKIGYDNDSAPPICLYDVLYDAGAFPIDQNDTACYGEPKALDEDSIWKIKFKPGVVARAGVADKNPSSALVFSGTTDAGIYDLTTPGQGNSLKVPWPVISDAYLFYAQVYGLLGTVEESQYTVFSRLTETFNFFRKSYYLNASTPECIKSPGGCGQEGLDSGYNLGANKLTKGSNVLYHYIEKMQFHAKVYTGGWNSAVGDAPYFHGKSDPAMDMRNQPDPKGLFQLATVKDEVLRNLGTGLPVFQGWDAPSNYFNVKFNEIAACKETGRPCVHARIATQCPQLVSARNNCVWPNPTPKYQTRLYP
ncbi:MAG TPA: hypothetical protein PKI19_06960 [Elusimicrobiales bacterium]|nr:hypothetical protein [Elusimicrobiales bacterium]